MFYVYLQFPCVVSVFCVFIAIHVFAWFGCVVHVLAPSQYLVFFGAYLVLIFAGFFLYDIF